MSNPPEHLVLTTYPSETSGNVGDLLITASFLDMLRSIGVDGETKVLFREVPLSEDLLAQFDDAPIFLPGMSISSNFYPKLYALCDIDRMPKSLIPFGCTWQHPIGYEDHAEVAAFTELSRSALDHIASSTGPIAVRDHLAARILRRNGVPTVTVGDCGWYHLPSIGTPMRRPEAITRVAITTPHSADLAGQSLAVVEMLKNLLPEAEITVFLHSKRTEHVDEIAAAASRAGLEVVDAAGNLEIFDRYADYDLHVGHRLHGHIGFLRRRIPSVLLIEDARSRGFSHSIPIGCFAAKKSSVGTEIVARLPLELARQQVRPDPMAINRVADFLTEEMATRFLRYIGIAPYLDRMFTEVVIPQLSRKIQVARSLRAG